MQKEKRTPRESFNLDDFVNDVKSALPSWKDVTSDKVSFSRLTGMTNMSFKITCKDTDVSPNPILYRQFGNLEGFLDKGVENYIYEFISQSGLGPKFYHKNEIFRLEEFVIGEHPTPMEFGSLIFRRLLMKYMVDFHGLNLEKLDRSPKILSQIDEGTIIKAVLEEIREKDSRDERDKKILEDIELLTTPEEIKFLKSIFPTREGSVAFCHNDLNNLNVFKMQSSPKESGMPKLLFIDLEYAAYDYVGRDIGNYLHEPTFDYTLGHPPFFRYLKENFPDRQEIEKIAGYYLIFRYLNQIKFPPESLDEVLPKILDDYDVAIKFIKEKGFDLEAFEKERKELVREIKVGELISNWHWTLWAVKMSKKVCMNLDYLEYASVKLKVYKELKQMYKKEYL